MPQEESSTLATTDIATVALKGGDEDIASQVKFYPKVYLRASMRYLSILLFTAGAVTLGMEFSASRLLEPAFGNSQIVWAALIGLILLYLALGAWLGGKLADRYPQRRELDYTMITAAAGIALAATFSRPVLLWAANGMATLKSGFWPVRYWLSFCSLASQASYWERPVPGSCVSPCAIPIAPVRSPVDSAASAPPAAYSAPSCPFSG